MALSKMEKYSICSRIKDKEKITKRDDATETAHPFLHGLI